MNEIFDKWKKLWCTPQTLYQLIVSRNLFQFQKLSAHSDCGLPDVPEWEEGDSKEEAKRSSKLRDEGELIVQILLHLLSYLVCYQDKSEAWENKNLKYLISI